MRIIVDGYEGMVEPDGEKNFGELLVSLNGWVRSNRKAIVGINADGVAVVPGEDRRIDTAPLESIKVLEVTTVGESQRIVDILTALNRVVPSLAANLGTIARLLRSGKYQEGYTLFAQCADSWNWVNRGVISLGEALAVDYETVRIGERKIGEHIRETMVIVQNTMEAFKRDDTVTVADLIEYELVPRIDAQKGLIVTLSGVAADRLMKGSDDR